MATAEVEEVEVFFDRINRIYRIEIGEVEETFDIGDFNLRAKLAKIGLYPDLLRFAGWRKSAPRRACVCIAKSPVRDEPNEASSTSLSALSHRAIGLEQSAERALVRLWLRRQVRFGLLLLLHCREASCLY